jgi:hypothetical protein
MHNAFSIPVEIDNIPQYKKTGERVQVMAVLSYFQASLSYHISYTGGKQKLYLWHRTELSFIGKFSWYTDTSTIIVSK